MKQIPLKKNLIEKEKLETLLVKNWAEFLNYRELLNSIKELIPKKTKLHTISISRFEITSKGFIIWTQVSVIDSNHCVNDILFEFLLLNNGDLLELNNI